MAKDPNSTLSALRRLIEWMESAPDSDAADIPALSSLLAETKAAIAIAKSGGQIVAASAAWTAAFGATAPPSSAAEQRIMRRAQCGVMHLVRCVASEGPHFAWLAESRAAAATPAAADTETDMTSAESAVEEAAEPAPAALVAEPAEEQEIAAPLIVLDFGPAEEEEAESSPSAAPAPCDLVQRRAEGLSEFERLQSEIAALKGQLAAALSQVEGLDQCSQQVALAYRTQVSVSEARTSDLESTRAELQTILAERSAVEASLQSSRESLEAVEARLREVEAFKDQMEERARAAELRASEAEARIARTQPILDLAAAIQEAHIDALSACIAAVTAIAPGAKRSMLIAELAGLIRQLSPAPQEVS